MAWSITQELGTFAIVLPVWLKSDDLLVEFGKRRAGARRKYQQFIEEGMNGESIRRDLKGEIYLGDDDFVERMQDKLGHREEDVNIPPLRYRFDPLKLLLGLAENGLGQLICAENFFLSLVEAESRIES